MSERKAINKYYPPDYDPTNVPKKRKTNAADKVRLMLPFSMKCLLCSEYIAARRKFNARKEVTAEKYMGVKLIHFHIKCPRCNNTLVFRTDPKSAGFVPVSGAVRNYEKLSADDPIPALETDDDIFARLEREDAENKQFQEQRLKRKTNPFWQAQKAASSSSTMEALEAKLLEQQHEQDVNDHLQRLQAQALRLSESGGADAVAARAERTIAASVKRSGSSPSTQAIRMLERRSAQRAQPPTVSGVISVTKAKTRAGDDAGRSATGQSAHRMAQPAPPPQPSTPPAASVAPPPHPVLSGSALSALAGYSSDEAD